MMRRWSTLGNRGIILITSYLLLSLFLVYSSAMTMRTTHQRMATELLRQRFQAADLAQGALEQLREDLYQFFLFSGVMDPMTGNVVPVLQWLDDVGQVVRGNTGVPLVPAFDLSSISVLGVVAGDTPLSSATPRTIFLPLTGGQTGSGQAWISNVCVDPAEEGPTVDCLPDTNIVAPRNVTIDATATVGGVTKRMRAIYQFSLGMSEIFRHAYFVNNYGWIDAQGGKLFQINGEMRSNGDMVFSGAMGNITLNGDAFAANNPDLVNPITGQVATGDITGDPTQAASWLNYYNTKSLGQSRPAMRKTNPTQPAITGGNSLMAASEGWESDVPQQTFYEQEKPVNIPYLGNLSMYKTLATSYKGNVGSKLTYNVDLNGDGNYLNDGAAGRKILTAEYNLAKGPDQIAGNADDGKPLVLIGSAGRPIVIDGPVIIPSDVILAGNVSGRGTLYAERNIHILGSVIYTKLPAWARIERSATTGQLRQTGVATGPASNLGTVCSNGAYIPPGGVIPSGCI